MSASPEQHDRPGAEAMPRVTPSANGQPKSCCAMPMTASASPSDFRSDMIRAHRQLQGQLTVPHMFTRLVCSIVKTVLAPKTFYRPNGDMRPYYGGLPSDFTAASIVALGERATRGFQTYHVVNPHDDGLLRLGRLLRDRSKRSLSRGYTVLIRTAFDYLSRRIGRSAWNSPGALAERMTA